MLFANKAEDAAKGIGGIFVTAHRNGINAHLYDWIIVAARLSHIAEVKDVLLFDLEFFHKVSHTKDFVHARNKGVNGGRAANFVFEFWGELFGTSNDCVALLVVWVPSIFNVRAGFLTKGREGDLREAIFDNFVAILKLIFFPEAKLARGSLDSFGDFCDLLVGEWVIIDLFPIFLLDTVAVVLGALSDKEMKMRKLFWCSFFEAINNLN